jgi:hypothetical protein
MQACRNVLCEENYVAKIADFVSLLFQFDLLRCCRDCHEELSAKTANIIAALKKESFP